MQANAVMLKFITDLNLMNASLPEIGTFRICFRQYYYGFPSSNCIKLQKKNDD